MRNILEEIASAIINRCLLSDKELPSMKSVFCRRFLKREYIQITSGKLCFDKLDYIPAQRRKLDFRPAAVNAAARS